MNAQGIPNHAELLTLANKLTAAAADEDPDRLATIANRLLHALIAHITFEWPDLLRIPLPEKRLYLKHGQDHILDLLRELALRIQDAAGTGTACDCQRITKQLLLELTVQAEDERLAGMDRSRGGWN